MILENKIAYKIKDTMGIITVLSSSSSSFYLFLSKKTKIKSVLSFIIYNSQFIISHEV